jgi:restriction system protein
VGFHSDEVGFLLHESCHHLFYGMHEQQEYSFDNEIPDSLEGRLEVSTLYQNFGVNGNRTSFGVDVSLSELKLQRSLKAKECYQLKEKIDGIIRIWSGKYEKHQKNEHCEERALYVDGLNQKAEEQRICLARLLEHSDGIELVRSFNPELSHNAFAVSPDEIVEELGELSYFSFALCGRPIEVQYRTNPTKPNLERASEGYGFFERLFSPKRIAGEVENRKKSWLSSWESDCRAVAVTNARRDEQLAKCKIAYARLLGEYEQRFSKKSKEYQEWLDAYRSGATESVLAYFLKALKTSEYPEFIPNEMVAEYREEEKLLVVLRQMPGLVAFPKVQSYKYIKSRDEVTSKKFPQNKHKFMYDDLLYQICLRSCSEVFSADEKGCVDSVAFNGYVEAVNPGTGVLETKIVMSLLVEKSQLMEVDLSLVEPRAAFLHLKGVAAADLSSLTAIPPIVTLETDDNRFVKGRKIVHSVDGSVNLAAMHWEDFEHLVREVFEKEFTANGGEVKITKASRDGGVDAIAFNPDPIMGGKVVIQAKRYTNVVGVAAVRDLYGTLLNEGATKGILVTTSHYGSDAYKFAKGKPISLLNGSNLLSLLEKHGTSAYIDTIEAKRILGEP